jgi:tRNA(Ile)-lysidine synthase
MDLIESFRNHLAQLPVQPGVSLVAVSGGPDSVALLDLLVQSRDLHDLDLIVAHLDHGIHPDSRLIAERVRALAESYGLPVEIGRLELGPHASETVARARRYDWLESVRLARAASTVFTAHHADDQAETVLMRVLAGSGPAGLAAMGPTQGSLVRPLLPFTHQALADYVRDRGLQVWLDPANQDTRHLRTWIRNEILPLLRTRLPRVDADLLRVAEQAARDKLAWDSLLELLPELEVRSEPGEISVAAPTLAGYDSPLAQTVILTMARRVGCPLTPSRVGRVLRLLEGRSSGARVPLGGGWIAELAFDRLRILPKSSDVKMEPWILEGRGGQGHWGRWRFHWEMAPAPEQQLRVSNEAWFTLDPLTVRGWDRGEKLKPLGGSGRRLIVRCFQEVQVPRSRRESWPILAQRNDIVWIPGVCRSDTRIPVPGVQALRVHAEYA